MDRDEKMGAELETACGYLYSALALSQFTDEIDDLSGALCNAHQVLASVKRRIVEKPKPADPAWKWVVADEGKSAVMVGYEGQAANDICTLKIDPKTGCIVLGKSGD